MPRIGALGLQGLGWLGFRGLGFTASGFRVVRV